MTDLHPVVECRSPDLTYVSAKPISYLKVLKFRPTVSQYCFGFFETLKNNPHRALKLFCFEVSFRSGERPSKITRAHCTIGSFVCIQQIVHHFSSPLAGNFGPGFGCYSGSLTKMFVRLFLKTRRKADIVRKSFLLEIYVV